MRTGASSESLPASTSRMIAVAVTVLVIEPIWNSVSPSTASGWSTFVTPKPATVSSPSAMRPTATPGTGCSRIAASTTYERPRAGASTVTWPLASAVLAL